MSAHSCPVNFVNILKLLFRFFASRSLNTKLNMLLFSWFQSNQVQTANLLPILFIYIKSLFSSRRVKLRILRLQFVYPKMAYCITSLWGLRSCSCHNFPKDYKNHNCAQLFQHRQYYTKNKKKKDFNKTFEYEQKCL